MALSRCSTSSLESEDSASWEVAGSSRMASLITQSKPSSPLRRTPSTSSCVIGHLSFQAECPLHSQAVHSAILMPKKEFIIEIVLDRECRQFAQEIACLETSSRLCGCLNVQDKTDRYLK